jgi:hypothetical protein
MSVWMCVHVHLSEQEKRRDCDLEGPCSKGVYICNVCM